MGAGGLTQDSGSLTLAAKEAYTGPTLVNGGTLVVTNVGSTALTNGDTFRLFAAATCQGAFAKVVLPPLPAGLAWSTSALNTNGTLSVGGPSQAVISQITISGGLLVFTGNSGSPNIGYATFYLLGSTNLATPISNWTRILTNQFDAFGGFNVTNAMKSNSSYMFYLLQTP
jgi:autotransporter-associated beta strand protein